MTEEEAERQARSAWLEGPAPKSRAMVAWNILSDMIWREGDISMSHHEKLASADPERLFEVVLESPYLQRPENEDAALSMCWVAACLGGEEARMYLCRSLSRISASQDPPRAPAYLNKLVVSWMNVPEGGLKGDYAPVDTSSRPLLQRRLAALMIEDPAEEVELNELAAAFDKYIQEEEEVPSLSLSKGTGRAPAPAADPAPEADDEPVVGMVVCEKVGDVRGIEGRGIEERYSNIIGKKIRFRGEVTDPMGTSNFLKEEFPWVGGLARFIGGQLLLLRNSGNNAFKMPPILLVGPPGSGKTRLLERLCENLGVAWNTIACGGVSDNAGIGAVTRGWATARASAPVEAMAQHDCANPVMVLDELDKGSGVESRNGSVMATLISMIQNSRSYYDTCLMTNVDISYVSFMATANDVSTLPPALRDRFAIFQVPRPDESHFEHLMRGVRRNEALRLDMHEDLLPYLPTEDVAWLRSAYVRSNCSIRALEQAHRLILGERAAEEMEMAMRPN